MDQWSNEEDELLIKLRDTDGLNFEAMEEWLKAPATILRKRWIHLMNDRLQKQPHREWTKEEEAMLIKLYQSGMTDRDELAAELGRTKKAVDARIHRLREHLPNRKKRTPPPTTTTFVEDRSDTETTEDEDDAMSDVASVQSKTIAKRQRPLIIQPSAPIVKKQEMAKLKLPLTMDVYDKMVGEPYYERRLRLIEYREWLVGLPPWFITNHFIEQEDVDYEVGKCNDLIRLLE